MSRRVSQFGEVQGARTPAQLARHYGVLAFRYYDAAVEARDQGDFGLVGAFQRRALVYRDRALLWDEAFWAGSFPFRDLLEDRVMPEVPAFGEQLVWGL